MIYVQWKDFKKHRTSTTTLNYWDWMTSCYMTLSYLPRWEENSQNSIQESFGLLINDNVYYEDTKPSEIMLTFGSVVMLFPFVMLRSYKQAEPLI